MLMFILAAVLTGPPGYDACVARIDRGGFVKSQMLDCATRELDRADAALNARYRMVMARLGKARRMTLKSEERRWIDRRRARCLAAERGPIPSPEINRRLCLVRETDLRTGYLERVR